ncbi:putative aquaporin 4, partial [Coprinopsis marcescibilis]
MRFRQMMREPVAEFLGVAMLVMFGNGVNCQVVLSTNPGVASSPQGDYFSINVGWAIGTAMGVWVSGGISGGHINPAVTLALATFRDFPWKKVPGYIFAQLLGGIAGAAIVYGNYFQAINIFEGGIHIRTEATRGLFATYPAAYLSGVACFFSEFLGAVILMFVVLAMNDKKNIPPPPGLAPLVLFLLVLGIGTSFGMQTAYAINPARDLGPRIVTAMAGYGGSVFTFRSQYWLWCPILGPILGAQVAALVYDGLLFTGDESALART